VPTRAEVSDVANAILDGTDAIMLSEETTLGDFPIEAVEMMSKVAKRVEADLMHKQLLSNGKDQSAKSVGECVNASAVRTADRLNAKYLVSFTGSGYSARMMSRHKPNQLIFVFTPNEVTYNKACLSFGCVPVSTGWFKDYNVMLKEIRNYFLKKKLAFKGDKVVIASGMPFGKVVETNMIVVETL
jgi:pyruvate kinase